MVVTIWNLKKVASHVWHVETVNAVNMIILENKIIGEKYVAGYYLTMEDLKRLVRDFQADCHDGFISNDEAYLEQWLKKHERIEKK